VLLSVELAKAFDLVEALELDALSRTTDLAVGVQKDGVLHSGAGEHERGTL
jgi:hypothetical protein